ncbi:hypothetical protein H6P81_003395 [Aristolochia fimbriata]|uniref:Uncharacterized protein n=1 Tax=Aristolochia fimbriata TaxID=158543 RepID=A0AAV7FCF3_ARIFI|nr:hypothetical protein H6P81_003395 [Aristolochia fimbriata]
MATGSAFALAVLPWPCLYKGLGHTAAGWPSMARWPYLYTWLAVYFHTHREDLEVSRRPASSGAVCGIDMFLPPPKLLSWWTKLKKPIARQHYESLLSVPQLFLDGPGADSFLCGAVLSSQICADSWLLSRSPRDIGITANHRRLALYRSWWPFGKPALFVLVAGLIYLRRENGTHLETQGPLQLIILGGRPTCRHYFSKIDWSRRQLFPRWRIVTRTMTAIGLTLPSPRRRARGQLVLLPAKARRGLLLPFWLNASGSHKEEEGHWESLREITPSEGLPVQEVAPSPSVVQEEAVIEAEALPPAVEEEDPTPAVEVPAIEAAVEVIQEEVPTTEGALETILAPEEAVIEVAPAAEEVSLVQARPPTSSSLTPSQTPSQEFLSYIEGLMVQAWRDRIVPRMLSPGVVAEMGHDVTSPSRVYTQQPTETLKEIEPSAGEKVRPDFRDEAEGIARNTLAVVSSKLEEAKATLGEVVEELSEAKAEEEDARERLS